MWSLITGWTQHRSSMLCFEYTTIEKHPCTLWDNQVFVCFFSVEGPVTNRDRAPRPSVRRQKDPDGTHQKKQKSSFEGSANNRNSWQLTQSSADTQTNRSTQKRQQKQTHRPPNDLLTTQHRTPAMQESREICSSFPFRSRLLFFFFFFFSVWWFPNVALLFVAELRPLHAPSYF